MRIAIDVSPLSHPRTGIGNYLRGIVGGLVEAAAGAHEIVPFAPVSRRGEAGVRAALGGLDVRPVLWRVAPAHRVRRAWSRLGRPPVERLLGPLDVVHFSDWLQPPQRAGVRATTVHDLVPLRFPEWTTRRTRALHGRTAREAARTCTLVVVNSAYTGRDVEERLGVPAGRIAVVHPGVDPRFGPQGERADLGAPYLLAVSTLEPRKGLDDLVRAFALVRERRPGLLLAVAGSEGWGEQPELDRAGVRPLGYVSDQELARLYRGAAALAYPSRFEGFGMPIVEALASGTAVVANAHASLDEACGTVALRADATDPSAFAAALERAFDGSAERRQGGLAHAARFTWRSAGERLLAAYDAAPRLGG